MKLRGSTYAAGCLAIVVAAGLVRLPLLQTGLWRDEASTALAVHGDFPALLSFVKAAEYNPPGYFILEWMVTRVAGTAEPALRAVSFAFAVAVVAATAELGRRVSSSGAGLFAAALLAFSVSAIFVSTDARPYALGAFFATAALICMIELARSPRPAAWAAGLAACGIVAEYASYTALLTIACATIGLPYVIERLQRRDRLPWYAAAYACMALAYIPWIGQLVSAARQGAPPWSQPGRVRTLAGFEQQFAFGFPINTLHAQVPWVLAAGFAVVASALILRFRKTRTPFWPSPFVTLIAIAVVAGAAAETGFVLDTERYMYTFAPAAAVWLASIIIWCLAPAAAGPRSAPRLALAAIAAVFTVQIVVAMPTGVVAALRAPDRSGMKRLLASLPASTGRSYYVLAPDYLALTFDYYENGASDRLPLFSEMNDGMKLSGYSAAWARADAARAAQTIAQAARSHDAIVFIDDGSGDQGTIPYSKAVAVRDILAAKYPALARARFEGRWESVNLTVFDPRASRAAGL